LTSGVTKRIKVGMASCGIAAGAEAVYRRLSQLASTVGLEVSPVGCIGLCYKEPLVEVEGPDGSYTYGDVNEALAERIFQEHVLGGKPLLEKVVTSSLEGVGSEARVLAKQFRVVLRNCGRINPERIEDYLERDGYKALEKALKEMTPEQVIDEISRSGLRGRGGAGFPTGTKWRFARQSPGSEKYMICNADEGDPGAFMDRSVLEGDPHSVIEGMTIGAYAIGASHGYIYCRAEYPLAIKRLQVALEQARSKGFLGDDILGTGFSFDITIKEGAGAFVCGEETALMASIEGKRGMPRPRPPFPAQRGLWGKPTNINNVETLANVPWILLNGAEAFASMGTERSKGTKVFALAGKINNPGLIEVPMGISLREVIMEVGGGIRGGKAFKAVQLGGPSGGCVVDLDIPVDYESITSTGAIMGSGGMIVMDEDTCIIDTAKFFLSFTQRESCGKCPYCRIGTKRMLEILTRISEGEAKLEDLEKLEELAHLVKDGSLCGLGQTAPNPVLTTLRYFRDEYLAHVVEKRCPARVCSKLLTYSIDESKCIGCTRCAKACPVGAISGELKKRHVIDQDRCVKCGECYRVCPVDAVTVR